MSKSNLMFIDDDDRSYDDDCDSKNTRIFSDGRSRTSNGTTKFRASHLRSNLTQKHKNRDPLFYYEILSSLGEGSMGTVAKVRKRKAIIGGSARQEVLQYYQRQKRLQCCFDLPIFGAFFAYCLKGFVNADSIHSKNLIIDVGSNPKSTNQFQALTGGEMEEDSLHEQLLYGQSPLDDTIHNEDDSADHIYAMKTIHLSRITDPMFVEELKNEIAILKHLDHPHIVKAIETYEHRDQIFFVMELCSGGDLHSRDPYPEPEAARIVTSIVSAVAYMHSKHILHRDLKFENVLFVNNSPQAEVKVIDFGMSMKFGKGQKLTEGVGTIYTMAPEVIKGSYTKQADLWSIGVIAYMLMSSQMPFYGRKRHDIVEQITKGRYEFKGPRWRRVSVEAREFIHSLLVVNPDDRADAEKALTDPWLNRRHTATVRNPYAEELQRTLATILKYAKYPRIKKIALLVCAHKSTALEIGILRKVFQKYDTERNGHLSYDEFKNALKGAGFNKESEYRTIFDAVDLDGTGKIQYTKFLAATIEVQGAIPEERLAEVFDRMDADSSGFICPADLRELLGEDVPHSEAKAIIDEANVSQNGKISYNDFLSLWQADKPNSTSFIKTSEEEAKPEIEDTCSRNDECMLEKERVFTQRIEVDMRGKEDSITTIEVAKFGNDGSSRSTEVGTLITEGTGSADSEDSDFFNVEGTSVANKPSPKVGSPQATKPKSTKSKSFLKRRAKLMLGPVYRLAKIPIKALKQTIVSSYSSNSQLTKVDKLKYK